MPAPATSRGRRNRRAHRDRVPALLNSQLKQLRRKWAVRHLTFEEAGSQFRQRTANMGLSELAEYLHLPMAEAARRLRLCSTALKHVCRRIGMSRWPSRQINAIDRQIARLQRDLVRGTRRGGLLAIKEELDRLQVRRARLYEGHNPGEGAE